MAGPKNNGSGTAEYITNCRHSLIARTTALEDARKARSDTSEIIEDFAVLRARIASLFGGTEDPKVRSFQDTLDRLLTECTVQAENHVEWCEWSIRAREEERDREVEHLKIERARVSAKLPIHRLPDEVLSMFFVCFADEEGPFAPLVVSQVSSFWRMVAFRTPTLWSRLELDIGLSCLFALRRNESVVKLRETLMMSPQYLQVQAAPGASMMDSRSPRGLVSIEDAKQWLARSGQGTPVDIRLHWMPPPDITDTATFFPGYTDNFIPSDASYRNVRTDWLSFIAALRPRWRSLTFLSDSHTGPAITEVTDFFGTSARAADFNSKLTATFNGSAPFLTELVFPRSPMDWSTIFFDFGGSVDEEVASLNAPRLRRLFLSQGATTFLRLSNMPCLTSLSLAADEISEIVKLDPIARDALRTLHVREMGCNKIAYQQLRVTVAAMEHCGIVLPSLEDLSFEDFPQVSSMPWGDLFGLLRVPKLTRLRLATNPSPRIRTRRTTTQFLVTPSPQIMDLIRKFILCHKFKPSLRELETVNVQLEDEAFTELLQQSPELHTLTVHAVKIPKTLAALARTPSGPMGPWLCPGLTTLELESKAGKKSLFRLLVLNRASQVKDGSRENLRSFIWDGLEQIR